MGWRRLGLVYAPVEGRPWAVSHASVPFAEALPNGLHRVWFSPRDATNRSHIAWLVLDIQRPEHILEMAPAPVLSCGPIGSFDDCGAMISWISGSQGRRLLYYVGWNIRGTVPFHVSIGAAEEVPSGWRRLGAPLLDRGLSDPWFCSNPCVLPDGEGWRMWYLSGLGWEKIGERLSPSYHICHARSADGVCWTERGRVVLPLEGDDYAIARPSVLWDGGEWLMWFCVRTRTRSYWLGAARSKDGLSWRRDSALANLPPAAEGWDSEMIAYPHVFVHAGRRWMLYCGNGFGRSGFGLAVWD